MTDHKPALNFVLAGQANVGKSVIFNHLTGLHQHIGNWPGKTIEKAEGKLFYKGYSFDVLDLPGIYSLTSYSAEELISREYILFQEPDFIVNVIDATNLERNLRIGCSITRGQTKQQHSGNRDDQNGYDRS